jgi:heme/copper-type cytochrome/quinol oxidase subunit 2
MFVFAITGAIFVVVAGLLIYTMIRFRRRPDDLSPRSLRRFTEATRSRSPGRLSLS